MGNSTQDLHGMTYLNRIQPMDMRKRWFEKTLPPPKRGSEARRPFDMRLENPPRASCSLTRFMYVTAGYGQHNNQLIALMNALVISRELNRTLIIGPFIYMSRSVLRSVVLSPGQPQRAETSLCISFIHPIHSSKGHLATSGIDEHPHPCPCTSRQ